MSYESYRTRVNLKGSTDRDRTINNYKETVLLSLHGSPSYAEVTLNDSSTPLDTWIVDDSTTKEQKILSTLDSSYTFGDYIQWNGETWLTLIVDDMGGIYKRGTIKRCISSLKWLDDEGLVKEAWFTTTTDMQRSLGLLDGKAMLLPDERRYLTVQNNLDTSKIIKGQRFIFDGNRCWMVSSISTLYTGLIHLVMEEDEINSSFDNASLRVVDYYALSSTSPSLNSGTSGSYTISISGSDYCKITTSQSYIGSIKINGVIDNSRTMTWQLFAEDGISSTTLASITSQNGVNVNIKATSNKSYGKVRLKATCVQDGLLHVDKTIQIKSLV